MVIIKCEKCDKEYEVKWTEEISNFQCEACGGDLRKLTLKEIWKRNPNELKKNDKGKQKDLDIENNWLALRSHSLKDFVKAIGKYENKGYVLHPESFNIGGLYGDQFYVLMEKKEKDDCPKKLLNMLNLFFTFDDDGRRKYSYQDISDMIKR